MRKSRRVRSSQDENGGSRVGGFTAGRRFPCNTSSHSTPPLGFSALPARRASYPTTPFKLKGLTAASHPTTPFGVSGFAPQHLLSGLRA